MNAVPEKVHKTSTIGKGGLLLGVAKLTFLLAAYATSIALTRLVSPSVFGRYAVVAALIAIPNMVIIQTLLFTVSRPMAAEFSDGVPSYAALRRRGLRLAAGLGGLAMLVFFLGAPVFAGLLNDGSLVDPIRVVAPISLVYALYAINIGTLNATRRFSLQATLDIFMAITKASLIIAAAWLGLELAVILGGFTGAAMLSLTLSAVFVASARPAGAKTSEAKGRIPPMASFAGMLVIFTAAVNLLQSTDLLVLKHFAVSQTQQDAVGFYSSAQLVARVPYSLMNAVSLLMFPLIATLHARRDERRVLAYVTETAKVSLLLLAFMSAVGSAAAGEVQALLFPKAYGSAADELRLLVWGFSGYSFAVTSAWVFNSSERTGVALGLVVLPLVLVFGCATVLIPAGFTSGAALGVAIAGGTGAVVALVALARSFGAVVPIRYAAKVVAAVLAVEALARVWPSFDSGGLGGKLMIVVKLAALAVTFVFVVAVTRAVTIRQLRELRRAA